MRLAQSILTCSATNRCVENPTRTIVAEEPRSTVGENHQKRFQHVYCLEYAGMLSTRPMGLPLNQLQPKPSQGRPRVDRRLRCPHAATSSGLSRAAGWIGYNHAIGTSPRQDRRRASVS